MSFLAVLITGVISSCLSSLVLKNISAQGIMVLLEVFDKLRHPKDDPGTMIIGLCGRNKIEQTLINVTKLVKGPQIFRDIPYSIHVIKQSDTG